MDYIGRFALAARTCNAFAEVYLQAHFRQESKQFSDYERLYITDSVGRRLMHKQLRIIWINKLLEYKG
jgi:hypothetical protein